MITACLFNTPSPGATDKGEKVSVKTADESLAEASAEGRLRCCECLEPVSPVHRGDWLNHFRHHPQTEKSPSCSLRSEAGFKRPRKKTSSWSLFARLKADNARLQRELEQTRTTLANVSLQLSKVETLLKAEQREAHEAEEIILHVKEDLKAA